MFQKEININFSIITVVKNDLQGLMNTKDSIYNQIFTDFEWIIIDGNSNDGTVEFIHNLNFQNIKFISENDNGIYDAMNKGIIFCSNNYVLYLNAGDTFNLSDSLSQVAAHLKNNPVDVLFCGVIQFLNRDISFYRKPIKIEKSIHHGLPGHHQGTFYSKSILNLVKYDTNFISADYKIIADMYNLGINSDILNFPVSKFLIGHYSFNNIYKILFSSTHIQYKILNTNYHLILFSFLKRLTISLLLQIIFNYPRLYIFYSFLRNLIISK